jgi:hypothetical protein
MLDIVIVVSEEHFSHILELLSRYRDVNLMQQPLYFFQLRIQVDEISKLPTSNVNFGLAYKVERYNVYDEFECFILSLFISAAPADHYRFKLSS